MDSNNPIDNKNEEEIPAVTIKTAEEYEEIIEKLRWNPTQYKIVELFIRDLLIAEKVEEENYFRFENIDFKAVKIKGTVAGLGQMGDKLVIRVDDGTAQIDCILSSNEKLEFLNKTINETLNLFTNLQEDSDVIDKGILILLSRCRKKLSTIPLNSNDDVKLGDTVILIGNLSQYYDNRNIFIKHIRFSKNCDATVEAYNLKRLLEKHCIV